MSQDEIVALEKMKEKIRTNIQKFARNTGKNEKLTFFIKWRTKVQLQRLIEDKYRALRKKLMIKQKFSRNLMVEKDKQESKVLINNYVSLENNTNFQKRLNQMVNPVNKKVITLKL